MAITTAIPTCNMAILMSRTNNIVRAYGEAPSTLRREDITTHLLNFRIEADRFMLNLPSRSLGVSFESVILSTMELSLQIEQARGEYISASFAAGLSHIRAAPVEPLSWQRGADYQPQPQPRAHHSFMDHLYRSNTTTRSLPEYEHSRLQNSSNISPIRPRNATQVVDSDSPDEGENRQLHSTPISPSMLNPRRFAERR